VGKMTIMSAVKGFGTFGVAIFNIRFSNFYFPYTNNKIGK